MGLYESLFGRGKEPQSPAQPESVSQQSQMSERLAEIAFFAVDHGIRSIENGSGPFVPFVLSEGADGKRKLDRYVSGNSEGWVVEESLAQARVAVSKLPSSVVAYAIAHDGYTTIQGVKYDAIFVEASERGKTGAVIMAQRYVPKTAQQNFERVGNPILFDEVTSRFR